MLDYEDDLFERDSYEVEFYAGGFEYDYEIDALTGDILSWDKDVDDDYYYHHQANNGNGNNAANNGNTSNTSNNTTSNTNNNTTNNNSSSLITAAEAQSIALAQAGLSSGDVTGLRAELDRDDGRTVYEVEFRSGRVEYSYDINASTGAVISYDIDYDD